MNQEQEIKEYALDLGFDEVGITTAEPFEQLEHALEERRDSYYWITEGLLELKKATNPLNALPGARSIIVLLYDYYKLAYPPSLLNTIGKAYQSRLYFGKRRIFGTRLKLFRDFLEQKGINLGMRPSMAERQAAVRAGVASFGYNTFIFAPGRGSYVSPVAIAVDRELEAVKYKPENRCSDNCRKCIEACPTGALYEPYKMNPLQCIAFHTYATGNFSLAPESIPYSIRENMGSWIYGCDICQDVCPYNQKKLKQELPPDAYLQEKSSEIDLLNLLHMDDSFYVEKVQPLLYGYIWKKSILQRNTAIALGNSGDAAYLGELSRALEDPEEEVRAYAAWAAGKIGGERARRILESQLDKEETERAKSEVKHALEMA